MATILALDQGTSSSRAIVFQSGGAHTSAVQLPLTQFYPRPGWVEHDPEEIWQTQIESARQAMAEAHLEARDIGAIGISNQRETTVLWSRRTGKPIHRALVWQDHRTADWCDAKRQEGLLDQVRAKTGLMIDPYFSASKLVWLLDHVPGARALAQAGELAFGTIDSWLIWKLTHGEKHLTDMTNASRTMLYDIHNGCWDEELCAAFGIPMQILPQVQVSASKFGETDYLGEPIAITGVAGDQQAALFGHNCLKSGQAKNTYGTGCFMLMHTGEEAVASKHGSLTTPAAQTSRHQEYALEGAVFNAGSVVQWLRDEMRLIDSSAEIEGLADSVPDTNGVFLVPAFNGLGSPYWDAHARGTIVGITRGTNRAHIARAALESIALQSAELLIAMQQDAGVHLSELLVDGGASANNLLMQMQADLLGVPVLRPQHIEATAFGAAGLAAHSIGIFQYAQRDDLDADVFQPKISRDEAQTRLARWRQAVDRSRAWE